MANRLFKDVAHTFEGGVVKLYGKVTLGASGAIASQSCKGFSVEKTASEVGRYTVTLEDKYSSLLSAQVAVQGADDAAYTSAKGLGWMLRAVDVSSSKTLYVQFLDREAAPADAEVADSSVLYIELTLKNSSAW
jgi:hypothetical protein